MVVMAHGCLRWRIRPFIAARAFPCALKQRANRLAFDRPRIHVRVAAREIGRFVEAGLRHPEVGQRRRDAEPCVQREQQQARFGRVAPANARATRRSASGARQRGCSARYAAASRHGSARVAVEGAAKRVLLVMQRHADRARRSRQATPVQRTAAGVAVRRIAHDHGQRFASARIDSSAIRLITGFASSAYNASTACAIAMPDAAEIRRQRQRQRRVVEAPSAARVAPGALQTALPS